MYKIEKIGIEIEGEFSDKLRKTLSKYGTIKPDGSVSNCRNEHCYGLRACEFASAPIDIDYEHKDKIINTYGIFGALRRAKAKRKFHWNESCGFHVHVSFARPKFPPEIFSKQFCDYFYSELKKDFPEVWSVRKGNRYCRAIIDEMEIAHHNTDRYRGINLWAARLKHSTIEFRIFPSDAPENMEKYLRFILNTVHKFISKKLSVKVDAELIDTEDFNENYSCEAITKEYSSTITP